MSNPKSRIIGTGSYLPEKILSNRDLEKIVDTSDEWIRSRTGMSERRIAAESETPSTLGCEAALRALKNASVTPLDIDLILVGTGSPDMLFPSTACLIQHKIGAKNAVAFDISAACSGFVYALSVADQFIKTGMYKKILIIGADVITRYLDWKDRNTCVLFGDGAGAVVLQAEKEGPGGILSTHIFSDGSYSEFLYLPGGGSSSPMTHESIDNKSQLLKMKGGSTFKIAVNKMVEASKKALLLNSLEISDIDILIPHQANFRIIKAVADNLSVPLEKVVINIERYGNTVAATIPVALDEAVKEGRIKSGDTILMVAFGGGLTWGAAIIRW